MHTHTLLPLGAVLHSTPQYSTVLHTNSNAPNERPRGSNIIEYHRRWRLQLLLLLLLLLFNSVSTSCDWSKSPNNPTKCFHCKPNRNRFSLIQTQNTSSALMNLSHQSKPVLFCFSLFRETYVLKICSVPWWISLKNQWSCSRLGSGPGCGSSDRMCVKLWVELCLSDSVSNKVTELKWFLTFIFYQPQRWGHHTDHCWFINNIIDPTHTRGHSHVFMPLVKHLISKMDYWIMFLQSSDQSTPSTSFPPFGPRRSGSLEAAVFVFQFSRTTDVQTDVFFFLCFRLMPKHKQVRQQQISDEPDTHR